MNVSLRPVHDDLQLRFHQLKIVEFSGMVQQGEVVHLEFFLALGVEMLSDVVEQRVVSFEVEVFEFVESDDLVSDVMDIIFVSESCVIDHLVQRVELLGHLELEVWV